MTPRAATLPVLGLVALLRCACAPSPGSTCSSSADCAGNAGGSLCDPRSRRCVSCLTDSDCAAPRVCDAARGACVACSLDKDCPQGQVCDQNACQPGCNPTKPCGAGTVCDPASGACVPCLSDPDCAPGQVCRKQACVQGCSPEQRCPSGTVCDSGTSSCVECVLDGHCQSATPRCNPATSRCVQCLPVLDNCPAGSYCDASSFFCRAGCRTDADCLAGNPSPASQGLSRCLVPTHTCVACLRSDDCPAGKVCGADNQCTAGCDSDARCSGGQVCCSGACQSLGSAANCNACGDACAAGQGCCARTCVSLTTVANCGGCGDACAGAANAVVGCVAGQCAIAGCNGTYRDCDGTLAGGCEVDIARDAAHCGGCAKPCPSAVNAVVACEGGSCAIASCTGTFRDCDANFSNGCELNADTDARNCGACGRVCTATNATPTCSAATCMVGTCTPPYRDCNAQYADGCETDTGTDIRNCGACGTTCQNQLCASGACSPMPSCKAIKRLFSSATDGAYTIDPDGTAGAIAAVQVQCDMRRDGGGWTFGIKNWYVAGIHGNAGAVGNVADALPLKGNPYKLSDVVIRAIIGAANRFDVLADQAGYNSAYSTGNYEYVILRNYTAPFRYDGLVPESSTPTTMESFRLSDNALAWSGRLACGQPGGAGINCLNPVIGNPQGGAGCSINMGSVTSATWHHFYMGETNSDTYLYICNGAQHSSSYPMNHRWWFREY